MKKTTEKIPFTSYQSLVIFILAITQFTVIVDFMVMAPLGDMLMKTMSLSPNKFSIAMSGYAISAGVASFCTAGFADRYDRKKLLLFFYTGFIFGTFCCGLANSFATLLAARIVTGLFGGVIGSITMAIVTDLFDIHHRGRVMGFIQMGLGASQVMGVPVSIAIANHTGWNVPFFCVGGLAVIIALVILWGLRPVTAHLSLQTTRSPFAHLLHTFSKRTYRITFLASCILPAGAFMLMPFSSAYAINNLHVTNAQLPIMFMVAGVSSLLLMPLIGTFSDKIDKFKLFAIGSVWMIITVILYTNLGVTPLKVVLLFNVLMTIGILNRMVPAGALMSAVPDMADRGAFMSMSSSLQQIAGAIGVNVAGYIVTKKNNTGPLEHYNTLGYVVCAISLIAIFLVYRVNVLVKNKLHEQKL